MTNRLRRPPVLVRRYGRARLYYPAAGRYVTVDELRSWTVSFIVVDADTGEDVTRVLMT